MKTLKNKNTYIKIIAICLLSTIAACKSQPEQEENRTSPITEAMIQGAACESDGYAFLAKRLQKLQKGNKSIDKIDSEPRGLNKAHSGNAMGFTALHYAVWLNRTDIIATLLRLGADVEKQDTERGGTPLHWAVVTASLTVVKTLLQKQGINVNARAKQGATPLSLAYNGFKKSATGSILQANYQAIIDALVKAGAQV